MENTANPPKISFITSLRQMGPSARREMRNGLLFISPWLIGFLAFTLLPIIATFLFSFMDLHVTDAIWPPKFVGLGNYAAVLKDSAIWNARPNSSPGAMWITFRFGLIALPVGF